MIKEDIGFFKVIALLALVRLRMWDERLAHVLCTSTTS
jgi:hypothetical protein